MDDGRCPSFSSPTCSFVPPSLIDDVVAHAPPSSPHLANRKSGSTWHANLARSVPNDTHPHPFLCWLKIESMNSDCILNHLLDMHVFLVSSSSQYWIWCLVCDVVFYVTMVIFLDDTSCQLVNKYCHGWWTLRPHSRLPHAPLCPPRSSMLLLLMPLLHLLTLPIGKWVCMACQSSAKRSKWHPSPPIFMLIQIDSKISDCNLNHLLEMHVFLVSSSSLYWIWCWQWRGVLCHYGNFSGWHFLSVSEQILSWMMDTAHAFSSSTCPFVPHSLINVFLLLMPLLHLLTLPVGKVGLHGTPI